MTAPMTPLRIFRALPWMLLTIALGCTLANLWEPAGGGPTWKDWTIGGCVLGAVILCVIDLLCLYNPWDKSE